MNILSGRIMHALYIIVDGKQNGCMWIYAPVLTFPLLELAKGIYAGLLQLTHTIHLHSLALLFDCLSLIYINANVLHDIH